MPGEPHDVLIYTEVTRTLGAEFPTKRSQTVRALLRSLPEIEPLRAAASQEGMYRKLSSVERKALLDKVRSSSVTSCVRLVNRLPQRNRMRLTETLKLRTDIAEADLFFDTEIHAQNPTSRADLLRQLSNFAVSTAALFTSHDAKQLSHGNAPSSSTIVAQNLRAHFAASSSFVCSDTRAFETLQEHAERLGLVVPEEITLAHDPPSAEVAQMLRGFALYA